MFIRLLSVSRGRAPASLLDIHLAVLAKPDKNSSLRKSKVPISLTNTLNKVLEAAVWNRFSPLKARVFNRQ